MPDILVAAESRNDIAALATMRLGWMSLAWLSSDEPGEAATQADLVFRPFRQLPYGSVHNLYMMASAHIDLYCGRPDRAWSTLEAMWPQLKRSFQLRMAATACELEDLRGRCALSLAAALGAGKRQTALLRTASQSIASLEKSPLAAARPMSLVLRAAVDAIGGRSELAADRLERAALAFEQLEMMMHAALCRRRLGAMLPAVSAPALGDRSDEWFRDQRVVNPDALCRVLVPALPAIARLAP
jgi:hypothetical protein